MEEKRKQQHWVQSTSSFATPLSLRVLDYNQKLNAQTKFIHLPTDAGLGIWAIGVKKFYSVQFKVTVYTMIIIHREKT